jgi:hypothetical protein
VATTPRWLRLRMRVSLIWAFVVLVVLPLTGCASSQDITYIDRNADLRLSDKELISAKKKAFAGNGNSAFEVFVHYSAGLHDHKRGDPWLRLALKNGSSTARDYAKQWQIAQPTDYARFRKERTVPKPGE